MTTDNVPTPAGTTSRPRSSQAGATQARVASARPAPSKRNSSLSWKSLILSAGVGVTLLGSTMFTRIEQANAAAEVARTAQASAVVQVVQALETAQSSRSAQWAAQANSAAQPRTIIVKVPVVGNSGQPVVNPAGGQPSGQPSGQPASQASQANFVSAPAASAIVMPAMPTKPTFQAPVTVTRKS